MPELTTVTTSTDGQYDDEALTAIVARSVLEAALAEGGAELWFDVGLDDETARLAIDFSTADLEEMLRLAGSDDVMLSLDGEYVAGLFDDADVEAHGLRGAIAVTVASAALLAPAAAQAATPQATTQSKPQTASAQVTTQVTPQVSAAATAQVSSLAARTKATLQARPQSKVQVSKAQLANVSGLKLLRSGLVR